MVEINDTGVIQKMTSFLKLRGKAIVTSRNSVYPAIIVNGENQAIPIKPPVIPETVDGFRMIRQYTAPAAGTTVLYTVPSGKVFYLCSWAVHTDATAGMDLLARTSTPTTYYDFTQIIASASAVTQNENRAIPFKLDAGETITVIYAVAGGWVSLYGWEQNA